LQPYIALIQARREDMKSQQRNTTCQSHLAERHRSSPGRIPRLETAATRATQHKIHQRIRCDKLRFYSPILLQLKFVSLLRFLAMQFRLQYLLAINRNITWSINTESYLIASDLNDRDADRVSDRYHLTHESTQYKHCSFL
jgi:hypothetical protein